MNRLSMDEVYFRKSAGKNTGKREYNDVSARMLATMMATMSERRMSGPF
ncbi:hypothetical protein [Spirosoma sp.]